MKWCSGNCPDEYLERCEFRETRTAELRHPNSSSELKKNIASAHPEVFEVICELISSIRNQLTNDYYSSPTDTAHHLIPGNECIKAPSNLELLRKLVNFFDYNVNCAENGIMLPTYYDQKLMKGEEPTAYYDTMDRNVGENKRVTALGNEKLWTGSQLHVGPHSYDGKLKKLKASHPKYMRLSTYEYAVIVELKKLQSFYSRKSDIICYMRDRDNLRSDFISMMNDISTSLRNDLRRFPNSIIAKLLGSTKLTPYVSFPAMIYDLGISREEYREKYL
jgi:hypothetical protein